jgi:hypothetical protein
MASIRGDFARGGKRVGAWMAAAGVAGVCGWGLPADGAVPVTTNGDPFTLVATQNGTNVQLFGLAADGTGKLYIGNNSNNTTGIPVQLFDQSLFSGVPIALSNFGPAVGDADGMAFLNNSLYVADRDEGLQKIAVPAGTAALYRAATAINGTGSPIVVRPIDGHVFVGRGGLTGDDHIDEYDAAGTFVTSHTTGTDVETMTYNPASGLIYYAPFGSAVRSLNPTTNVDLPVGSSSGTIDGALTFDPISGLLFLGTANGANSGLVETINPVTGETKSFASGFEGSTGILRDPFSGDLYFLGTSSINADLFNNVLYRIDSSKVPEPGTLGVLALGAAAVMVGRRKRGM